MKLSKIRAAVALTAVAAMTVGVTACGSSSASGSSENDKTINFWDPYPQHKAGSDWDKLVQSCAPDGYTLKRQGVATADLINNLTTAVKADNAPDVAIIDNPAMPSAVDAGLITDVKDAGVNTDGFDENIEGPGVVDGTQYGVAFGTNALGLYYNPQVLEKAGVDISTVKDWDSLNEAIKKVVDSGAKGITFSGITGEEGVFQFEPWFWGANGDLSKPESQAAKDAQDLLSGWVKNGWAPKSVATDNQSASWDLFLTGEYGFAENGSWQAATAQEKGFKSIPIPAKDGGVANVPTGGEFATLPFHKKANADKTKAAADAINCLTSDDNLVKTNETLGYLAAKKDVRTKQVAENPLWEPWVDSVEKAEGRTTKVGLKYEDISATLSKNLQAALNS
ncbi:sugar ABC transporter substrate-binding protein [Bifidobacterium felsineum]|uniref:sugar ABC transporter substrate-binding protein n=1 Tax=Bifidobacterium felsineum TaxID=2045440 RepID=UPI001BDC0F8A|nr:extracellular solute-binding protein [Bifidobacterium felsineum]MBT1165137.1 extracellular solute-binding protein [Bifidobacterium felsineum]